MSEKTFEEFIKEIIKSDISSIENYYKAFTHSSVIGKENYERLEFLGDAVLHLVISDILYEEHPLEKEGFLSQKRISFVNRKVLARLSRKLHFHKWISLGRGEKNDEGCDKESILADVFEAFLAALYLDKGFNFVLQWVKANIHLFHMVRDGIEDYKSILQELLQSKQRNLPIYELDREEGLPHKKVFYIKLMLDDGFQVFGVGKTKKAAEQDAARKALKIFYSKNETEKS